MILSIAPILLFPQSPKAKAANRIREQYLAAEAPVLRLGSGVREAEQFLWT